MAELEFIAEPELVGLEGGFGLAWMAKDLSAGSDCGHTVSVDLAAPVEHLYGFIDRVDVMNAFPFRHLRLHHREKCDHELLLALEADAERHHAHS